MNTQSLLPCVEPDVADGIFKSTSGNSSKFEVSSKTKKISRQNNNVRKSLEDNQRSQICSMFVCIVLLQFAPKFYILQKLKLLSTSTFKKIWKWLPLSKMLSTVQTFLHEANQNGLLNSDFSDKNIHTNRTEKKLVF